jgi:hypothetical protein
MDSIEIVEIRVRAKPGTHVEQATAAAASQAAPSPLPIAQSIALTRATKACAFRQAKGCGCSGARCARTQW